jgi:tRNA G18 (ribose-2'-O)-methylase SpoU
MLHVEKIDSLERPELEPYRTMKWQLEHRQKGIFVAEGEKVVVRLLESDLTVVSLLLPERVLQRLQPLISRRTETIHAFTAEKPMLEQLTGFSMYQGVMAVGKVPPALTLASLLAQASKPCLVVAVEGLSNAENLGALVRNCVAFGVEGLIVGETSSSPFLRRAVRNSMGTIFRLPVVESERLVDSLAHLRQMGLACIAAHPHTTQPLTAADFTKDCCVVFGSEGSGISAPILDLCDPAVAIPMAPQVDSLNVGSAAAVFLYEVQRQRRKNALRE